MYLARLDAHSGRSSRCTSMSIYSPLIQSKVLGLNPLHPFLRVVSCFSSHVSTRFNVEKAHIWLVGWHRSASPSDAGGYLGRSVHMSLTAGILDTEIPPVFRA